MDSGPSWKDKLSQFRIKELKDVLTKLARPKQGKKQDLMERILALISAGDQSSKVHGFEKNNFPSKNEIVKIIDDTYRKMQINGANDLASKSHGSSDFNIVKPKEEVAYSYKHDVKVRCICGIASNTLASNAQSLLKCEDAQCMIWQHINCVIVPDNQEHCVLPEIPSQFYCEICRINRADPFWVTLGHPLHATKLNKSNHGPDGTLTVQTTERTFQLSKTDREVLQRTDFDLQVWCILLNDKVPFRMQWPQFIEVTVNGLPIRTINRPGSQLLGINGRDDGPIITTCSREGGNKISLSQADARVFCFGIRLTKRKTLQQALPRVQKQIYNEVLNMVPKESEGEIFEDALSRVRRCICGGNTEKCVDSDSDIEVVADNVPVNLRCPMSGARMKIAGRFKPCVHMGCFDLETFLELNQRSKKWQCPICLKNYTLENIIIDPYFNRITSLLRECGEDVNEIEVKPDGSWRVKNETEHKELGQWHLPDGSLCTFAKTEMKPELETMKQIKQEGFSDGPTNTNIKLKRNRNGIWKVCKPGHLPSEKYEPNNILISNSPTGNYRDGEDRSVNQGAVPYDFSINTKDRNNTLPKNPNVIVLDSDSEDELTGNSPNIRFDNPNSLPNSRPVISEAYINDHGACTSVMNPIVNCPEYGMPYWPLESCPQPGSGYQFFDTDVPPDAMSNVLPDSLGCQTVGGYESTPDGGRENSLFMEDIPTCHGTEINGTLVDNLAFVNDDPSLQIFLPTRHADVSMQADNNEHADVSNGIKTDDWISLRLGAAGSSQGQSSTADGLVRGHHVPSRGIRGGRSESLVDSDSFHLSMNDDRSHNNVNLNTKQFDGPFSHPRQPRSVRPRVLLSINTDSGSDS